MKEYVSAEKASVILANERFLEYPNLDTNLEEFPEIDNPPLDPLGNEISPSGLIIDVMTYIGREPKRVLDLGCGHGADGIYLATHGHDVTAIDAPKPTDFANSWAHDLGIQDNYRAIPGDALQLSPNDKYDVIIANMLLHFMEKADSSKLLIAMRAATLMRGINIISVYTDDNPEGEALPPRNMKQYFEAGVIAKTYPQMYWQALRNIGGYGRRAVNRSYLGPDTHLIPTVDEFVARKVAEPAPAATSFTISNSSAKAIKF